MIFMLMLRGLRYGKARFICAVAGIAVATGTLVFMSSLVATHAAQAPALAAKACAPWVAWSLETGGDLQLTALQMTVDYRPGGHVLQGPPMRAFVAIAPAGNPYAAVRQSEGRWPDSAAETPEVVCVKNAMRRFGSSAPALGETLKFVGRNGTMSAKIVGYLEGEKLPREFPYVFANPAAFAALEGETTCTVSLYRTLPSNAQSLLTPVSPEVVSYFKGDEQRRMDYATPLLMIAALLTALSLLVNSLLLSVEANRSTLATLRMVGLTRAGVVRFVTREALFTAFVGWGVGVLGSMAALALYVAADNGAFPASVAYSGGNILLTLVLVPVVSFAAVLFALAPALKVRVLDAAARMPRSRRRGMAITFALGFAAFVAVEVWGASLMRGFVPSIEWPDAIVSLLPSGVSSFDIEKLRDIPGVRRISELVPRQLFFPGAETGPEKPPQPGKRPPMRPNALFLAAEFLPKFTFVEGDWESSDKALAEGDAVVITRMMSNAHNLHRGDSLVVTRRGRRGAPPEELAFPIAGVVDLNWHMVTSRGLVRGLNRAPGMTDGPVFCSLETMGIIDPRTYMTEPAMSAPMTHLWVEYDSAFLEKHGVFQAGRLIEAEIAKRLGNPTEATVRLHARDEIADGTLAHGTDVIGQAARVPFVFLAILAIGFVAMLVAELDARRHEWRVLRAVGATHLQVAARLAASALKTASVGILIGLPLGAFAGWYAAIGTAAHWPGMPHYFVVPWPVVIEGALGAIIFALIFAIPTSLALTRVKRCPLGVFICLLLFVFAGASYADVPAYTNHAGHAVLGVPIALTPQNVTLTNGAEQIVCRLSIFPEREKRRIAADAGSTLFVPKSIRLAVEGAENAMRRSRLRAEKGFCTREENEEYCTRERAQLRRYLAKEVAEGRLLPSERRLFTP